MGLETSVLIYYVLFLVETDTAHWHPYRSAQGVQLGAARK